MSNLVPVLQNKKIKAIHFKEKKCSSGVLCYRTVHSGFITKIGRAIIRTFTSGLYEHITLVCKPHQSFNNQFWTSRYASIGLVKIEKEKYYSVESTQSDGVVVCDLEERLLTPSLLEVGKDWSGFIYYGKFKKERIIKDKHLELTQFIKNANESKYQYQIFVAIISTFPRQIRNCFFRLFRIDYRPQADCSIWVTSLVNIIFDMRLKEIDMMSYTPQKAVDLLFSERYMEKEDVIMRYDKGKLIEYDKNIFEIEFE